MMTKYIIIIEVDTDAPEAAMQELEYLAGVQVEALNDGTMDLGTEQQPDIVNAKYTYTTKLTKVL